MKICHISTVHDPFDVRIFHKECVTLSESNDVHLIANHSKKEIVNFTKCIKHHKALLF